MGMLKTSPIILHTYGKHSSSSIYFSSLDEPGTCASFGSFSSYRSQTPTFVCFTFRTSSGLKTPFLDVMRVLRRLPPRAIVVSCEGESSDGSRAGIDHAFLCPFRRWWRCDIPRVNV